MNKKDFNRLKKETKKTINKMTASGYTEKNLQVIFNEKYCQGNYDGNILLNYMEMDEDVDFIILPFNIQYVKGRWDGTK